jgi:hypothetical protein
MSLRTLHVVQSVNPVGSGPIESIRQTARCQRPFRPPGVDRLPRSPRSPLPRLPRGARGAPGRSWIDRFIPLSLLRWIRAHRHEFDAVVVNSIWDLHLLAGYLAVRGTSTPVLVFPTGCWIPGFATAIPSNTSRNGSYGPGPSIPPCGVPMPFASPAIRSGSSPANPSGSTTAIKW